MAAYKIIIVEDELIIAEDIKVMLDELGHDIIGVAKNATVAANMLKNHTPDIVLLDIMMPGNIDGIDLAKHIRENYEIAIIFLTSHSDRQTVDRAKEIQPDGYLVKPFNKKDLFSAIEIGYTNYTHKITQTKAQIHNNTSEYNFINDGIFIREDYQLVKIRFADILFIESDGNYIKIHCQTQKHIVRSTLKDFLSHLPAQFIQIHKSYAVNVNQITAMDYCSVKLNDITIPMGRAYYENMKNRLSIGK